MAMLEIKDLEVLTFTDQDIKNLQLDIQNLNNQLNSLSDEIKRKDQLNITKNNIDDVNILVSLEKKENETEVNIQPTSIKPRISIQEIDDRLLTIDDFL